MTNNNSGNKLIPLAELTFMPMGFYVLTQWNNIHTWQGLALWFMVFALVQNEYLSIRNYSFRHYNAWVYLLDIWSLFMYIFALEALTQNNFGIGYDPIFCLGVKIW